MLVGIKDASTHVVCLTSWLSLNPHCTVSYPSTVAEFPSPIMMFDTAAKVPQHSSLQGNTATKHLDSKIICISSSPARYITVGINTSSFKHIILSLVVIRELINFIQHYIQALVILAVVEVKIVAESRFKDRYSLMYSSLTSILLFLLSFGAFLLYRRHLKSITPLSLLWSQPHRNVFIISFAI